MTKNEQNLANFTKIDIFYNIVSKFVSIKMVIVTNVFPYSSFFECNLWLITNYASVFGNSVF